MRLSPVLVLLFATAAAAHPGASNDIPPPPPMPANPPATRPAPPPQEGDAEVIEPQVTIVQRGDNVVQEYRIGGRLYMIKITPPKGYPYFLIDTDGDGNLETRQSELANPPVPQWVLIRW